MVADGKGRVWVSVAGEPDIALLNPASGALQEFTYTAPPVATNSSAHHPFGAPTTPLNPNAVWLQHIVAMTTDGSGHLWYVRAGSGTIEEVAA
jgi:hypothetical protein